MQFSLSTILFLITIAGLCLVIWSQWQKLDATRLELNALKKKGGRLEISDADKIQIVQVNSRLEVLTWRWRIYVPSGRTASLNVAFADIPKEGYPTRLRGRELKTGEQVVTYSFHKNEYGYYQPTGDFRSERGHGGWADRNKKNSIDLAWLTDRKKYMDQTYVGLDAVDHNAWSLGRTLEMKDIGKITLLRLRKTGNEGETPRRSTGFIPTLAPGFMVWIEDTTNK